MKTSNKILIGGFGFLVIVIIAFHILATLIELFKTSPEIGSWKYPGDDVFDTKKNEAGEEILNPETGKPIAVDVTPGFLKFLDQSFYARRNYFQGENQFVLHQK